MLRDISLSDGHDMNAPSTAARDDIRFILNDRPVSLRGVKPDDTLLDHLRLEAGLSGTKEGCAEGDCGACTVLVAGADGDYQPVNACIRLMGSLNAHHVVTIEHLARGALHPAQRAMVDHHGAQCGFCTPGVVMALTADWLQGGRDARAALQGNLCRCTGYAPILRAAEALADISPQDDPLVAGAADMRARLAGLAGRVAAPGVIIPATEAELADDLKAHQGATLVAGATDVGLWVTKEMRAIAPAIFIGAIEDLRGVEIGAHAVTLGAGVSYAQFRPVIDAHFPHLKTLWSRIGGPQVRAMGTIGGNIANGSPIGDTPPALIALGAEITLNSARGERRMALEDFFIDYGKQDRADDEYLSRIHIPLPRAGHIDAAYKISKRFDEDISTLCGAFHLEMSGGVVAQARIAFGGMAGTPARATRAEAALTGARLDEAALRKAQDALDADYQPLSDWRASADYRRLAARGLLERFMTEAASKEDAS